MARLHSENMIAKSSALNHLLCSVPKSQFSKFCHVHFEKAHSSSFLINYLLGISNILSCGKLIAVSCKFLGMKELKLVKSNSVFKFYFRALDCITWHLNLSLFLENQINWSHQRGLGSGLLRQCWNQAWLQRCL